MTGFISLSDSNRTVGAFVSSRVLDSDFFVFIFLSPGAFAPVMDNYQKAYYGVNLVLLSIKDGVLMGKITRHARAEKTLELLTDNWLGCENFFISSNEIKGEMEKHGWSRKTVGRYLERLVKEGKFEIKGGERSHSYRPKQAYWDNTMQMIPINTKINDAEYMLFRDLAGEITATFNEAQSLAFQDKYKHREIVRGSGLSKEDFDALNRLRRKLSRDIKSSLSRDYSRDDMDSKVKYEILGKNIERIIKDYMKLWLFIQKTHGARENFSGRFKRRIG